MLPIIGFRALEWRIKWKKMENEMETGIIDTLEKLAVGGFSK